MNIVLVEPQIPANTGTIARACAATSTTLHLVGKLGFKVSEKELRRAGLDYWPFVDVRYYADFDEFLAHCDLTEESGKLYFFSKKAGKNYSDIKFRKGDYLVFGNETLGLAEEFHTRFKDCFYSIPILQKHVRSLNLSMAAGIVLFEAYRQTGFHFETRDTY